MEACNVAGYAILAQVRAGTREPPATIADYKALLPALPVGL